MTASQDSFRPKLAAAMSVGGGREAVDKAINGLVADEERSRPLKAGDLAPEFALHALGGGEASSAELLRSGPFVVTFYRGLWCPYCRSDLDDLQAAAADMGRLGARALAICHLADGGAGPAPGEPHPSVPVLDDASGKVAVGFGIRWSIEETSAIEDALGLDGALFRGTEPWIVPMQARFVVGRDGRVAHSNVAFRYEERERPAELLALLASLGNRQPGS